MITRRSFLTLTAALAASPAVAGGVTVHLYGDSITHGYAAGAFSSEIPTRNIFWAMRSVWAVARTVLGENGAPYSVSYLADGSNHPTSTTPSPFVGLGARGIIEPHDWVVLEDAGVHTANPQIYRDGWLQTVEAIRTVPDVNIVMMTMFDYPPAQTLAQYDRPFSGKSMNQVTTEVARQVGASLIDMNTIMDEFRESAGVPVMHRDGVHPNAWGQAMMTGEILRAVGARRYVRSVEGLWSAIQPHWQRYGYGAANWTETRCRSLLDYTLIRGESP